MPALIEVKDVVNRFGPQTVHDHLDLTLEKGEILGLVGGSGSGKSVLLRTILGLNPPAKGNVLIEGKDIYALAGGEEKILQKKWGVLFQDGALFSGLSVLDNVALPLREYTELRPSTIEDLSKIKLQIVGLKPETAEKYPSELSGGMVRRAAVARALALDPEMLFLDEPTGALDPVSAASFDELILSLRETLNLSVLIITHDLDTLTTVCDRVAMIVDKKIIIGTLDEMTRSDNPAVHAFFNGPRMRSVTKSKKKEKS